MVDGPGGRDLPRGLVEARDLSLALGVDLEVLDGVAEIATAEREIAAIARQPDLDYPVPSSGFVPLYRSKEEKT